MIEVKKTLQVSSAAFFNHILEALRYELDQNEKSKVEIKQGIRYQKKLMNKIGTTGLVDVEIVKLTDDKYSASFKTSQGETVTSYKVEALEDQLCEVTYSEEFIGASKTKQLNNKLMSLLYRRRSTKRMKYLLQAIETHILNKGE